MVLIGPTSISHQNSFDWVVVFWEFWLSHRSLSVLVKNSEKEFVTQCSDEFNEDGVLKLQIFFSNVAP